MSLLNIKEQLLKDLFVLRNATQFGDVNRDTTHKFNQILERAQVELNLDLRGLHIQPSDHTAPWPGRHSDEGPIKPEDQHKCWMNGHAFRARIENVIARLDAYEA